MPPAATINFAAAMMGPRLYPVCKQRRNRWRAVESAAWAETGIALRQTATIRSAAAAATGASPYRSNNRDLAQVLPFVSQKIELVKN